MQDYLVPFDLNETLGAHRCDPTSFCSRRITCKCASCHAGKPSVLEPYGIGLVLYFKMLKFLTIIFLLMSFALMPSIFFYWSGSSIPIQDKKALIEVSFFNALFFTTIGSLGAGTASCMEGTMGQTFELSCASGVFKSIEAHWGEPVGGCDCPASQKLTDAGTCPGTITYPTEWANLGGKCAGGACFESVTDLDDTCCANTRTDPANGDISPDLSDVNIAPNFGCHSPAAQFIADGICLGNSNCTFVLSNAHEYHWDYSDKYETHCDLEMFASSADPLVDPVWSGPVDKTCTQSLNDSFTNFTQCTSGSLAMDEPEYKMIVVGLCVDELLTFSLPSWTGVDLEYTFEKTNIISYISYIDSAVIVLFLYAIYWLRIKEEASIDEADQVSSASEAAPTRSSKTLAVHTVNTRNGFSERAALRPTLAPLFLPPSPLVHTVFVVPQNLCSPADFTVFIQNLPPHESFEELEVILREHLGKTLQTNYDNDKSDDKAPEDLSIFDINFAQNNRYEIKIKKARGHLARTKDKMENEVYWLNQFGKYTDKVKTKVSSGTSAARSTGWKKRRRTTGSEHAAQVCSGRAKRGRFVPPPSYLFTRVFEQF